MSVHTDARYYEPTSGRFLSADPFGHGASPSLYDFAGGDPVNFFDPTGRITNPPPPADRFTNGLYMPTEVNRDTLLRNPAIRGQNPDDPNPGIFNGVATVAVDSGTRFLNQLYKDLINAPQGIVDSAGSAVGHLWNLLDPGTQCQQVRDILDAINALGKLQTYNDTASYLITPEGFADSVFNIEIGIAGSALGGVSSGSAAAEGPEISPSDLAGKTRSEIQDLADRKGLVPKGDPTDPNFPRKWIDPVTGEERLRLDRGHIDPTTGQPYDNPNAAVDHVHGYDQNGNPIKVNGDRHIPTRGE